MINRTKLEHILEYARQQRRFGQHCKIPPGDMVEIVEIAMRKAGNSPVTPDGWISCSERMPDSNCLYLCWGTYFEGDEPGYIPAYFFVYQTNGWTEWQPVEDDCNPREVIITHWMSLPAAPKQEVK